LNRAPTLAPIGDKSVARDSRLTFTVSATDPDTNDTLTLAASSLPSGATFDPSTGEFDWTPTISDVGTHQVTFAVVDDGTPQQWDEEVVTLTVTDGSSPDPANSSGNGTNGNSGCWIQVLLSP
jgi:hypothetical protein